MAGILVLASECEIPSGSVREYTNNRPELRHNEICEKLKSQHVPLIYITPKDECPLYCDSGYITFLRGGYKSALESRDKDWFSDDSLTPNHQTKNINDIRRVPLYKQAGFYINDYMSPIIESTWVNVTASLTLAEEAVRTAIHDNKVVYALTPSPGHHATFSSGGGYCFLNNGAAAAMKFLSFGCKKGAILDVDYHAGDGTQRIFYERSDVLTISIHANPYYEYPSFTGYEDETGTGSGEGYNVNYPLSQGTNWDIYKNVLIKALDKIKDFSPEFLIIPFGGDTYKDDPDQNNLCRFELDLDDYRSMGRLIYSYYPDVPIVITQEGGYNMENISTIVWNFLDSFRLRS